ncbi:replicative DNA helicase [Novosphingopyxis baekryungensis]|uniref:replicative DNA helicase n=1 Tax=Novosphingopyxis baekryungensis TaxID=279369 RepID=UPI000A006200|nr:replicative DNA helicase [Novosphingopyxis baekryungensis]
MAEAIRLVSDGALDGDGGDGPTRLPHNIEAEAALLGALLLDNRVAEDVQTKLQVHHFFEPLHGRIYGQVLKLLDRNMVVTPVTLKPFFEQDEALKEVGGTGYLVRLTESNIGLIGARNFAEQIYDLALLRELVSVGRHLVENALDTSESIDPKQQIEDAESALYKVSEGESESGQATDFLTASTEAIRLVERALQAGGNLSGTTTGLDTINRKIGGLHASDLTILAGRPGMGKTALATNFAFNAAARYMRDMADGIEPAQSVGAKVAFFSLEMSADQLATRILAEQSGISSEHLRMGKISREEFRELSRASRDLQDLPLYIDDTAGLTIAGLRARARRLQRRHGIGLIIVDYLQLLQGSGRAQDNRVNEISEISRGLKMLAKELSVPVLALSQLSRAVEQREDKRPQLSDLRESGSIEQDADIVLFIFRAEYYHDALRPDAPNQDGSSPPDVVEKWAQWEERHQQLVNRATLIVAKQRHGSTGNVPLHFQAEITKFSDLAGDYYEDDYGDE